MVVSIRGLRKNSRSYLEKLILDPVLCKTRTYVYIYIYIYIYIILYLYFEVDDPYLCVWEVVNNGVYVRFYSVYVYVYVCVCVCVCVSVYVCVCTYVLAQIYLFT